MKKHRYKISQSILWRLFIVSIGFLILLFLTSCKPLEDNELSDLEEKGITLVGTAAELINFFELEEGAAIAQLTADIDIGGEMLKLNNTRGEITIMGEGFTISGHGSCVIRLDDECSIKLLDVKIIGDQIGIGLLGGGAISASNCTVNAASHAIQAIKKLTVISGSRLNITSGGGMGILCDGFVAENGASINIVGDAAALQSQSGNIVLMQNAVVECSSMGDNTLKTDGDLELYGLSKLIAVNKGEHNAAKIGTLIVYESSASLELTGGTNGISLFIVEQHEDIEVKGFVTKEVRVEVGAGNINFSE